MNTLRFQKWLTLSAIFLLISFTSKAQTGSIKGVLLDSTLNELIYGAIVSVPENPSIGAQSDFDGIFSISNVKAGTYNLKISYVGYKEILLTDIVVTAGQTTDLGTITMIVDEEVPVIEIVGEVSTNTEEAVVQEIKESDNVVSGISAEQIQKGQDKDAAQVVQRIPGVSVVDNRFIMIRGLNDRYNSVWLNNATAPSSETDRKSFSFDMVPSGLIDRIMVYKTPSADLPGDFAGGFVKIYTVTPKEKVFNVNVGLGYRQGTTFKNFNKDKSPTDWLGFDSGQRAVPTETAGYTTTSGVSDGDLNAYGQSFKNNWKYNTIKALPDGRFNMTYINSFMPKNGARFGVLASINYTNLNTNYNIKRTDTDGSGVKTQLRDDHQYTNEVKAASMLNFSYILNDRNKLELRNFFNQQGRTQITNRNQYDASDELNRVQYALAYRSRTIYTTQLAGEHKLKNDKTMLDWTLGYGYSRKNEPDLRRASYYPDPSNPGGPNLIFPANNANDLTNGGRLYQKLNENSILATVNINQKINKKIGSFEFAELDAGSYNEYKSRTFRARAFGYTLQGASRGGTFWNDTLQYQPIDQVYDPNNVDNGRGWTILEESNPTYKYDASNRLIALYTSGKFNFGSKIKLIAGLRYENNLQYIASGLNGAPISQELPTSFLLPSLNLSYNFTEKSLLRLAYGKTLNRPEFREFAPFYFYDFDFNAVNYGSLYFGKTLKVCQIQNFDLRYEFYPSPGETVSLALFYKSFKDPIEQIALATSGGAASALAYSYTNALGAYNVGMELEIKKNLAFVNDNFKNFSLLFNASLIKSEVSIPKDQSDFWNAKRPQQGQSPYMVNAGLYYENPDHGWSASVLYNIFGPRIVIVGNSNYPDVVETPRSTIDLSVTRQLSKRVALNLGANDILNQSVTWVQDYNRDGKYERNGEDNKLLTYKKGNYFTATLRIKLQ
ncbi:MAG: TonB-dependent receptor domain-containing protein [Cytophaga sp.]|uniref:TonB-dependent receptor n=1 Tax=Cytophaga sp. TaxID=29535 RepID=UPI003F7D50C7